VLSVSEGWQFSETWYGRAPNIINGNLEISLSANDAAVFTIEK
jgi:hypothetical protein